jgi:hypothetical protein
MTDTELLDKLERIIKQRGSVEFKWLDNSGTAVNSYFSDEKHRTGDDIREFLDWIEEDSMTIDTAGLEASIATCDRVSAALRGAAEDIK